MLLFKTLHIITLATADMMVSRRIAAEKSVKVLDETLPAE